MKKMINDIILFTKEYKSIIFIFSLAIISVLIIISIEPIMYKRYEQDIKSNIMSSYNNYIEKIYFCENDNTTLEINMFEEFEKLEFSEIESTIQSIDIKIEEINENYKSSNTKAPNIDELLIKAILIHCNNNIYTYNNEKLYKNNNKYTLIENLKEQINLKIAIEDEDYIIQKYLQDISDIETLKNFLKIENVDECKNEILYIVAKRNYENDDYLLAKDLLEKIINYKDSKELLDKLNNIHKFDGKWYGIMPNTSNISGLSPLSMPSHEWIFKGNKCYLIYNTYNKKNSYDTYYNSIENNTIYIYEKEKYIGNKEKSIIVMNYIDNVLKYEHRVFKLELMSIHKTDDSTELPKTQTILEPSIGMTSEEVKKSTWGSPYEINKDTYSWGTSEQWVYKKGKYSYKYIYFKNGYVSSISE